MNTVLITGADRGLGFCMAQAFLGRGFHVFAGQYMPEWPELAALKQAHGEALTLVPLDVSSDASVLGAAQILRGATNRLDMLVCNAAIVQAGEGEIETGIHTERTLDCFNVNVMGALRVAKACLPLMQEGMMRLCFVSSEAGSISLCTRDGMYGYPMSKTALNMAVRLLFNELAPKGYTFRLYHPGWLQTYMGGTKNISATLPPEVSAKVAAEQFLEPRDWEDTLMMLDNEGAAWPF